MGGGAGGVRCWHMPHSGVDWLVINDTSQPVDRAQMVSLMIYSRESLIEPRITPSVAA